MSKQARALAIHEAGHVLYSLSIGWRFYSVTIEARHAANPEVNGALYYQESAAASPNLNPLPTLKPSFLTSEAAREQSRLDLRAALAGLVAEVESKAPASYDLLYRANSDLEIARFHIDQLATDPLERYREMMQAFDDLRRFFNRNQTRRDLKKLSSELLKRGTLSYSEVLALLSKQPRQTLNGKLYRPIPKVV